jgi:hypothetical protein
MALVQNQSGRAAATYVALIQGEKAGFRQYLGMSAPTDGSDAKRMTQTYPAVTGVPSAFFIKQELTYEAATALRAKGGDPKSVDVTKADPNDTKYVATLMLKDAVSAEVVGVNFDMHDPLGGKLVGMLNALRMEKRLGEDMSVRLFYAAPGSKYNLTEKGRTSINMSPNIEGADEKVQPVFTDEHGNPILNTEDVKNKAGEVVALAGSPAMLPMGVVAATVKGKQIWDFSARDNVITATALTVLAAFKAPADNHAEEEGANFADAAAAAAPQP